MKKFLFLYIRVVLIFLIIVEANKIQAQASACTVTPNFIFNVGANGLVNFTNTSAPSLTTTTYFWKYGNGSSTSTLASAPYTYTANGTYSVVLFATTNASTTCTDSIIKVINITSFSCSLNANFSVIQGTNGLVNFTNTTTGTVASTSYSWDYGDATATSTSMAAPHTYSANGTYTITLNVNTFSPTCSSTKTMVININSYCSLASSFFSTKSNNGGVNFQSTSTGTNAGTTYNWNFGDGVTGSGASVFHTYTNNGVYSVSLTVTNTSPTCSSTSIKPDTITSLCFLNVGFTHTIGPGGAVIFNDVSIGTSTNTIYSWDFGDGFSGFGKMPSHAYLSAGAYTITLFVNSGGTCTNNISQAINITSAPCIANSSFSIVPTSTLQYWTITPSYPWNIIAASWDWGDGSSSNSLYSSHSYSSAGTYSICLSVSVSCGATSKTCFSKYISKGTESTAIVYVNVMPPNTIPIGIENLEIENLNCTIYPNPNNGNFNLKITGSTSKNIETYIYNLVGNIIYQDKSEIIKEDFIKTIELNNISDGIYFIKINHNNKCLIKKLVISR